TNADFAKALGKALGRPSFFPTPGFGLRLLLGGAADIVLTGQRVLPRRAQALGYAFRYPTVDAALANILRGRRRDRTPPLDAPRRARGALYVKFAAAGGRFGVGERLFSWAGGRRRRPRPRPRRANG